MAHDVRHLQEDMAHESSADQSGSAKRGRLHHVDPYRLGKKVGFRGSHTPAKRWVLGFYGVTHPGKKMGLEF